MEVGRARKISNKLSDLDYAKKQLKGLVGVQQPDDIVVNLRDSEGVVSSFEVCIEDDPDIVSKTNAFLMSLLEDKVERLSEQLNELK